MKQITNTGDDKEAWITKHWEYKNVIDTLWTLTVWTKVHIEHNVVTIDADTYINKLDLKCIANGDL